MVVGIKKFVRERWTVTRDGNVSLQLQIGQLSVITVFK